MVRWGAELFRGGKNSKHLILRLGIPERLERFHASCLKSQADLLCTQICHPRNNMAQKKIEDSLVNLRKANSSLHEAASAQPRTDIVVAAIIKNFEFNYELSWKSMRRLLEHHGIPTSTPRQSIAESYRKQFIQHETVWLSMIEDRNLTVHTYDEAFARQMADRICNSYLFVFDDFLKFLETEVSKI
jgi:nucleotidyltransferase substrate binding protein (TIGR01987 family)